MVIPSRNNTEDARTICTNGRLSNHSSNHGDNDHTSMHNRHTVYSENIQMNLKRNPIDHICVRGWPVICK